MNFLKKKQYQHLDIFELPKKKKSILKKIGEKVLPSLFVFGTGITVGFLTYEIFSFLLSLSESFITYLMSSNIDFSQIINNNIKPSYYLITLDILSAISYIAGITFSIKGALKIKESQDNPDKININVGFIFMFLSAILVSLPSFLTA